MFILAIDQGTSSTKTIIFDKNGDAVAKGHADLHTDYFDNGFVEQNPEEIYSNVLDSVALCIQEFEKKGHNLEEIASCGISNQRETFILWDKSGKPLSPAVVWACKRSVEICQKLISDEYENTPIGGWRAFIRQKTGLIIDPYFSATKLLWLLENDNNLKSKLENGEVHFGTVDCWLLWKMTGGKSYKTDYTNAHRTLLFNIHTLQWDKEILALWGLEKLNLPEVRPSSSEFGVWNWEISHQKYPFTIQHSSFTIHSMIGDSHAATFGEGCFEKGTAKVTLGTGSSIMMNIGDKPVLSNNGMLTTICWSTENRVDYALEGAIVACGSTIEWVKNQLGFFKEVSETEAMALSVNDNAGVYLIPAFSGLGAPHWQMDRKASIEGMTFGTTKNHIVRAALESIPYQIKDVIVAMQNDMGGELKSISVNGGLTRNQFVIKFLVDLLDLPLKKQQNPDVSAMGAAYLAGLKSGVYESIDQIQTLNQGKTEKILPDPQNTEVIKAYKGWLSIIQK
jgi:glycerol kinase